MKRGGNINQDKNGKFISELRKENNTRTISREKKKHLIIIILLVILLITITIFIVYKLSEIISLKKVIDNQLVSIKDWSRKAIKKQYGDEVK